MRAVILIVVLALSIGCGGKAGPPGPAGAKGDKGDSGTQGAPGATGASGIGIASKLYCSTINGGWRFSYQTVAFSDGGRFVACDVSDDYSQSSASRLYPSSVVGATSGACIVTFDADGTASAGFWDFHLTGSAGAVAVYHDAGSPYDNSSVTLACQ